jgi:Exostosin family
VRSRLQQLVHRRGLFQNTTADQERVLQGKLHGAEMRAYGRRYAEMIKASKFILCPRGFSVSNVRLFDTMRMGRVPVILSDQWIEPAGPSWHKFSIRIGERKLDRILPTLEEREGEAIEMGRLARAQWEDWFSERACFHRVIEWCLDIKGPAPSTGKVGAPVRLPAIFATVPFSSSPPHEVSFTAATIRRSLAIGNRKLPNAGLVCVPRDDRRTC